MASADTRAAAPLVAAVLLAASLGGCASSAAPRDTAGIDSASDVAASDAPSADARALADAGGLVVVGTYTAASGRTCRRLSDASGRVLARTSCLQANGEWKLGRALDGDGREPGVSRPLTPALVPAVPAVAATPAPVTVGPGSDAHVEVLGEGETLWAFSARVTGDPMNWTRIARLNGIADAAELESGTALEVPASLATAGHRRDGR